MPTIEHALPFEKPLAELHDKLERLREKAAATQGLDLSAEIQLVERRLTARTEQIFRDLSAWDRVQVARHQARPVFADYLNLCFTEPVELHGDRAFADDFAMFAGFAMLDTVRCVLVGHRKGKTTTERMATNFGMAHPEGYRKAMRAMRLAEKFGLPVVTLINTPGAYPGVGAEERGQSQAIAQNIFEMSRLRTPIVCAVIGEGGSGGALGIGVGDRVLMQEHAYYSVISPEGCASILWKSKDPAKAAEAAKALKLTSGDMLANGLVDEVVPEPLGGAHRDPKQAADLLKAALLRNVRDLQDLAADELVARRYTKLRAYGSASLRGIERAGAPA